MKPAYFLVLALISLVLFVQTVTAQTTQFTYQGNLTSGGSPANGNFDLEFALFTALSGGSQLGTTQTLTGIAVANGAFTVSLDFGNQFPGADRWIEVRVRPAGGGAYTTLSPRQKIASQPYAMKSLSADTAASATNATNATNAANAANATTAATATNALQLGGVAANQYVLTGDVRLSDARSPLPGSANYIQNQNSAPQASSNFNISGDGTAGGTLSANTVNATTQFNIAGNRVMSVAGTRNLFAGLGAGAANTTGSENSFFGYSAGTANTTGLGNSFFGYRAGTANTTSGSSFFGYEAGAANTTGCCNSFFGTGTGGVNTIGERNSFFGQTAGVANTTGGGNSFFGLAAGEANTTGSENSFFGVGAGSLNTTGFNNTIIGRSANVASGNLSYATAIGSGTVVFTNNTIALGRSAGQDTVQIPGALNVTGAFNANGANLTNLNANNIASGTLAVARGGTGLNSPGTFGNFLRSAGSGWTSLPLISSDLPAGSTNYIQNGTSLQASSNFNISGNGTIGNRLWLASGTAVAPSASFTGDVNTGMYQSAIDTLNFSTNGVSRMQIDPVGNVSIGGNLTIPASTRYVSIPGVTFQPASPSLPWSALSGYLYGTTAGYQGTFFAPLNLPHGATITQLQAIVFDNHVSFAIDVCIRRLDSAGVISNPVCISTPSASPSLQTLLSGSLNLLVDNQNNSYYLVASWPIPATVTDIRLYSARITFTVTSPLP